MKPETNRNIKLGFFMIAGTILLISALYLIGSKQNVFGSTFRVSAVFYNVSGLMTGHNVRFAGIDVGTVEKIEIISDTSVKVIMVIDDDARQHIRKNAIASIGTDGLMGNKLVNINASQEMAEPLEEGDVLRTLRPIEMDEAMRTLNTTNENLKAITVNLKSITEKISLSNSLWSLLMDTVVAENVKTSIVNIKIMSEQSAKITGDLSRITEDVKNGKGIGSIITDTTLSSRVNQTVVKLDQLSDTAAIITGDISSITRDLREGKGTFGVLLTDTMLIHHLNQSMKKIDKGSSLLNEDLEALRHSWPFKRYFKKKEK